MNRVSKHQRLYNPIFVTSQHDPIIVTEEDRPVNAGAVSMGRGRGAVIGKRRHEAVFWVIKLFCSLVVVVITHTYTGVKLHGTTQPSAPNKSNLL